MNNNPADLLKLLLPIFFLVLWAVSQIMNRQGAARSRNAGLGVNPRPNPGLGPRPGGLPPAPRPNNRPTYREPTPPPNRPGASDDGIVILSEESARRNRPGPGPGKGRGGKPNRRPANAPAPAALPASKAPEVDFTGISAVKADALRPPEIRSLREALRSPERFREALILNELLGPPISRRPRRGRRG